MLLYIAGRTWPWPSQEAKPDHRVATSRRAPDGTANHSLPELTSMPDKSTAVTIPLRRMTQAELDAFLEKAADILRGNVDHSEFRGYVFALASSSPSVFVRLRTASSKMSLMRLKNSNAKT